jgi:hypothetical protein
MLNLKLPFASERANLTSLPLLLVKIIFASAGKSSSTTD